MSWLNSSLNTIKGQLTTLAQEVLAETAGPGDTEYRGSDEDAKTPIELLAETQKEKEDLYKVCSDQEQKIALLNKQIAEFQNKTSDRGGGGGSTTLAAGGTSGRTSKTSSENNATLDDSWCWEPDHGGKQDNDRSSESSSSGNGNEMVNITLEEVPLGGPKHMSAAANAAHLQKRMQKLKEENEQLNLLLEELDNQHNVAMQNVLDIRNELQGKLAAVTKDYEALKKEHADKFINTELELGKLRKQVDQLVKEQQQVDVEKQQMQQDIDRYTAELRKTVEELADLQALLHKRDEDNVELIERVKAADQAASEMTDERDELLQRVDQLLREMDEVKKTQEMKTSESSSSKQSEDEFIVVREGDANSSEPSTPPTKEELRDKIVALENRVSELTLENGSLALKLQDREMEKELAVNALRENLQTLQERCEEQETKLKAAETERLQQVAAFNDLQERAAESGKAQQQLQTLTEEKQRIETEIEKMKQTVSGAVELETRLLISEQEKEQLQVELQGLRSAQERVAELESKVQNLTLEKQQLQLNDEAEKEMVNNSAELEMKLKNLTEENESMRLELENIAHAKFRQAIAEEKQEITDLDADDEEPFSVENLRQLLHVSTTNELSEGVQESVEKTYRSLRERLNKASHWEKSVAQLTEEVVELKNSKLVWDHEKKTLEADISQYILQCDELMKNNEILLNELENYKRNKLETIHEHNEENILHLEAQLEEYAKVNHTLETEYAELNEKLEELDREKQELTEKLRATQQRNEDLVTAEQNLRLQCEHLVAEKSNMLFELNELKSSDEQEAGTSVALKEMEEKCKDLESQLTRLSRDHSDLVATLQTQKLALGEAIKKREEREVDVKHLKDENMTLRQELVAKDVIAEQLRSDINALQIGYDQLAKVMLEKSLLEQQLFDSEQNAGNAADLRAQLEELQNSLSGLVPIEQMNEVQRVNEELRTQLEELKQLEAKQCVELSTLRQHHSSQDNLTENTNAELQKTIDLLMYEKTEMIKGLQQKHTENVQYYTEIQRLQTLVNQLQEDLNGMKLKPCEKCTEQESIISDLRKEQEKLKDQVTFLREKSDILTTNLLTEQSNQKLVAQEKSEIEAQNASVRKDLERLREHLLQVEDLHTQETMEMQHELDETKAKLNALQGEVAKSSNAYTSASIRANQHAETLQAQYALVVQQRDELVAKLSSAEDRDLKNQAALCNLQCALEQFQNDRENDIRAATQRIRKELNQEMDKEAQLQMEIVSLNQQLADANQGLNAAARLSDQLEASQQTIAALREEVETLKEHNANLEAKLTSSESSQSDKIDKSLIKSLLIGYIVSNNPNDKNQVLRMISSVLDFTPNESDRIGLNKQQSSWLSAIIGGAGGASGAQGSKDNLVQAFVQFLEQESQPKVDTANMPNLLNITLTPSAVTDATQSPEAGTSAAGPTAASRRTSVGSNSGGATQSPIPIQPLLLNSDVLNEFAPTRNSSSILKDILSDS